VFGQCISFVCVVHVLVVGLYLCCISGDDWVVYCAYVILVSRCGRLAISVYVVTPWIQACTCVAPGLNRLAVLFLVIHMHALVLTLVQVASTRARRSDELFFRVALPRETALRAIQ